MGLSVFGARIGHQGALDITRKSGRGDGLVFAPSWAILRPALAARRSGDAAQMEAAWAAYVPAYLAEMRASYRAHRDAWERLLGRERVVLACYCTDPERCHRTLLGRDILTRLGAVWCGETGR